MTGVKVSIGLTNQSWPGGPAELPQHLVDVAEAAETAGVDTLWVPDHLLQADPTVTDGAEDMHEAWTTLGFLAGRTERIRLGTMVSAVTFRPPALLVKAVTTVDVLSNGRAWLGVGAGYDRDEADRMGLSMPPVVERFERLAETVALARHMWHGDTTAFQGTHLQLTGPVGRPPPISRPHPRILIGGDGERRTLRLVAEHADACNLFDIPDGGRTVRRKLRVLAQHCDAVGRPYTVIEKTLGTRLSPGETSDDLVARAREHAALGIDHLVVVRSSAWGTEAIGVLADAVPRLRDLAPRRTPPPADGGTDADR